MTNVYKVPIYRGSTRSLVTTVESDGFFGKDGLGDNKNICYKEIKEQNESAAEALIEMSKQFPGNCSPLYYIIKVNYETI